MAFHALRRRLRPRTRLKQALFRVAAALHRRPELKRRIVRAVARVPALDQRLRRVLNPAAVATAGVAPLPPNAYPRGVYRLFQRLVAAREVARHGSLGQTPGTQLSGGKRPSLAFVSPFPPQQSGIADYAFVLLDELQKYYDVTMISEAPLKVDPWLAARFPVRDPQWLERHGYGFDRVLYQVGNSTFHTHMLSLIQKLPGVVMLHDFYLSGLRLWLYNTGEDFYGWFDSLRHAHGWPALAEAARAGNDAARAKYPCNKDVLDASLGVLTHSLYATQLAERWYGLDTADRFTLVPFALQRGVDGVDPEKRAKVRAAFGFGEDDFVVASFGHIAATKRNDALLDAWLASDLAADPHAHLVFVGQPDGGEYGTGMKARVEALGEAGRVRITGFADADLYADWLLVADLAVQLRTQSRGETSGTIFDCLAYGVPVVLNAHAWAAELPREAVIRLPDAFTPEQLRDTLTHYHRDREAARAQGAAGRRFVMARHTPAMTAAAFHEAIERNYAEYGATHREVLATTHAMPHANDDELIQIALGLYQDTPRLNPPQWLIDVTPLLDGTASASSVATYEALFDTLLRHGHPGWRIEPVFFDTAYYRYASGATMRRLGLPDNLLSDEPVDVRPGDRFLGLGLADVEHEQARNTLTAWQRTGVTLAWLFADAERIAPPTSAAGNVQPDQTQDRFDTRLVVPLHLADRLLATTPALAATLEAKLEASGLKRPAHLGISVCAAEPAAIDAALAAAPDTWWPRRAPAITLPSPETAPA